MSSIARWLCLIVAMVSMVASGVHASLFSQRVTTVVPSLAGPVDVVVDGTSGRLYFSSYLGCTLNVVNLRAAHLGNLSSFVVGGSDDVTNCTFLDDAVGTRARFKSPVGIALDAPEGVLYICDQGNHRIRRLYVNSSNFSADTFAGTGAPGRVDDYRNASKFNSPSGIVLYGSGSTGVLYIADLDNGCIRKVPLWLSIVMTLAMDGGSTLAGCVFLVGNRAMTMFYVSSRLHTILSLNVTSGAVSVIAGQSVNPGVNNGAAVSAQFNNPRGVALTPDESAVLVGDLGNYRLRRVDLVQATVSTIAGTGEAITTDGLLLNASFSGIGGIRWNCNTSAATCGVLVAEYTETFTTLTSIRYAAIDHAATLTTTPHSTQSLSGTNVSATMSKSKSTTSTGTTSTATTSLHSLLATNTYSHPSTTSIMRTISVALMSPSRTNASTSSSASALASPSPSGLRHSLLSLSLSFCLSMNGSVRASHSPTRLRELVRRTSTRTVLVTSSRSFTASGTSLQLTSASLYASVTPQACSSVTEDNTAVLLTGSLAAALSNTSNGTIVALLSGAAGSAASRPTVDAASHVAAVTLSALSIERSLLVRGPTLIWNVSIISALPLLHWDVVHVTASSTAGSLRWATSRAPDGGWYAVSVNAPTDGWLGTAGTASSLLDQRFTLAAVLGCGGSDVPVMVVTVVVPAPGVLRALAAQVAAATRSSQIVALLAGGASSGSSLGRVMATRSMVVCDADDAVGGGVVDFSLVICPESAALVTARSAIVSNAAMIAIVGAVLALMALGWSWRLGVSLAHAVRVFGLPSSLHPAAMTVMPSTAAAVTLLAGRTDASGPCGATDVVLMIVGIAVLGVPTCALVALDVGLARPLGWACVSTVELVEGRKRLVPWTARSRGVLWLRQILRPQWEWRDAADAGALKHAWVVLKEYRLLWYATSEAVLLLAVAILAVAGGLEGQGNAALCRGCSIAVVLLLATQLGAVAVSRPLTSLFSFVHSLVTVALTLVSVVVQLLFVATTDASGSGLWLANMSAGCNLAVVGVSAVKMLIDLAEILRALQKRVTVFSKHQRFLPVPTVHLHEGVDDGIRSRDGSSPHNGSSALTLPDAENEMIAEAELLFWDASGAAFGTGMVDDGDANVDTINGVTIQPQGGNLLRSFDV